MSRPDESDDLLKLLKVAENKAKSQVNKGKAPLEEKYFVSSSDPKTIEKGKSKGSATSSPTTKSGSSQSKSADPKKNEDPSAKVGPSEAPASGGRKYQNLGSLKIFYPMLKYFINGAEYNQFLTESEMLVGRHPPDGHIAIKIKDVSQVHCKFTKKGVVWFLEDVGSSNGTYVNGRLLLKGEKIKIRENCTLSLGGFPVEFRFPPEFKVNTTEESFSARFKKTHSKTLIVLLVYVVILTVLSHLLWVELKPTPKPSFVVSSIIETQKEEEPETTLTKKNFEVKPVEEEDIPQEVKDTLEKTEDKPFEDEVVTDMESTLEQTDSKQDSSQSVDFSPSSNLLMGAGSSSSGRMSSRFGSKRMRALRKNGGAGTESGVNWALRWLAKHQDPEGFWNGAFYQRQCTEEPKCTYAIGQEHQDATTALALLAFLGAGHTEGEGLYKETVRKAIKYLIAQQNSDGSFGDSKNNMYTHSICTLALCEAQQFPQGVYKKRGAAQQGLSYLLSSQTPGAGWRYRPQEVPNDMSITVWCLMALKAGRYAELKVPDQSFVDAMAFTDQMTDPKDFMVAYDGGFPQKTKRITMTAAAVACRLFMKESRESQAIDKGIKLMLEDLPGVQYPKKVDFYYWYYGTIAMFQYGHEPWEKWNEALKQVLISSQKKEGCEKGSWDPKCEYFGRAARVMSTSVGILMLEIYYRYPRVSPYSF